MSFIPAKIFRIYSLCDAEARVRYIGITKHDLLVRLHAHMKQSRRGKTYRDTWIRSLTCTPVISLLEETSDPSRENHWIAFFRTIGCKLTNLTDGGEGITGYRHTEESRARMSAFHKGIKRSEEARKNYSAAAKKRWIDDPSLRQFYSDRLQGHTVSEATRKKIGEHRRLLIASGWRHPCKGKKHSEQRKKKNSDAQKARYANGAVSQRLGFVVSDETRLKLSESGKRRYANGASSPTKGMKFSSEIRNKMSLAAKLREANKTK